MMNAITSQRIDLPAVPMTDAGLRALFAAAMLGVGLTVTPAWSQCDGGEMTIEELLATDSLGYEQFGYAVAVSGNVALVGANEDDDLGSNSGSAYVFRFDGNGWTQEQKLLASDGAGGDMFGLSVALAGDVAVIGAPRNDDAGSNSGSAYVFRFDGDSWVEEQKLVAPDGASWDALGTSVGLSGGQVLAGAYDDDLGYNSGAVYVFSDDGTTWNFDGKILPSDGLANQFFGDRVDVQGDVAVIGAYGDYELGSPTGAAYVFRFVDGEWQEEQKLHASDAGALDEFGRAVAITGDLLVVGAPNEGNPGNGLPVGQGAAYVFRFDGTSWSQDAKLMDAEGAAQDKFGASVAITEGVAVVGSPSDDDNGTQSGSAFLFHHDGLSWVEQVQLVAPEGSNAGKFGHAVARVGNQAVVGALSGSAFMVMGGGGAASTGEPGDANQDGVTDVDDLIFVLMNWGPCGETCEGDLNCDEMITVDDLLLVITNWDEPEN
jgi:hypothetical protein